MLGLVDGNGAWIVSYRYDAWGKPLGIGGSLANTLGVLQPFRYRGYVFDEETGDYYLRSRYYQPEWCRFVNADNLIWGNTYSYCNNSPLSNIDLSGLTPVSISLGKPQALWQVSDVLDGGGGGLAGIGLFIAFDKFLDTIQSIFRPNDKGVSEEYSQIDSLSYGADTITGVGGISYSEAITYDTLIGINVSVDEKWKNSASVYWAASLKHNQIIVYQPLTFDEARARVNNYGSVLCADQPAALAIVIVERYRNAVCEDPHHQNDPTYLPHYHPTRNHTSRDYSTHIWFLK